MSEEYKQRKGNEVNKIYLAGRYSRRAELFHYAGRLSSLGYQVTSRWLNGTHDLQSGPDDDELRRQIAMEDVADIRRCDILIVFTEEQGTGSSGRGGRHVEFGIAFALNKAIWVVGPRENVFHCLPGLYYISNWEDLLDFAANGLRIDAFLPAAPCD